MKLTEKKQLIEKVCENINPEKEGFFGILADHRKGDYYGIGSMEFVSDGIKQLLLNGSESEDNNHRAVAMAVMRGVYAAIDDGLDPDFAMFDDDDEEDDDCYDCELLKVCGNERAIKWRTALGIPKPKNHKKGGCKVNVN